MLCNFHVNSTTLYLSFHLVSNKFNLPTFNEDIEEVGAISSITNNSSNLICMLVLPMVSPMSHQLPLFHQLEFMSSSSCNLQHHICLRMPLCTRCGYGNWSKNLDLHRPWQREYPPWGWLPIWRSPLLPTTPPPLNTLNLQQLVSCQSHSPCRHHFTLVPSSYRIYL